MIMSKVIVCRNSENDPPNTLRNRLGRPLKLAPNSKIGISNVNVMRPEDNIYIFENTKIGFGYINNGNNSDFQLTEDIKAGQYSREEFAAEVMNHLNNLLIPNGGNAYNANNRPERMTFGYDNKYILSDILNDCTTNSIANVAYNSATAEYSIEIQTQPIKYLTAAGTDVDTELEILFNTGNAGSFNIVAPAVIPGPQSAGFRMVTAQSPGSFLMAQDLSLRKTDPAYTTMTGISFIKTSTGDTVLRLEANYGYDQPNVERVVDLIVTYKGATTTKQFRVSGGFVQFRQVIFHRFGSKCGIAFKLFDTRGSKLYTVQGILIDIDANLWDNAEYDIKYSQDAYFNNNVSFTQTGFIHSPYVPLMLSSGSTKKMYLVNKEKPLNNTIYNLRNKIKMQNIETFKFWKQQDIENEENGIIDIPEAPYEIPQLPPFTPSTLELYFMPLDCYQELGFLYQYTDPYGNFAYYNKSENVLDTIEFNSEYALLNTASEVQCTVLIRNVPISGICMNDNGDGNSFNVLDSISLIWNSAGSYVSNFRPPIMQSINSKEQMLLTELELNLVAADGITPIQISGGAIVTLYVTGIVE